MLHVCARMHVCIRAQQPFTSKRPLSSLCLWVVMVAESPENQTAVCSSPFRELSSGGSGQLPSSLGPVRVGAIVDRAGMVRAVFVPATFPPGALCVRDLSSGSRMCMPLTPSLSS